MLVYEETSGPGPRLGLYVRMEMVMWELVISRGKETQPCVMRKA
jgi:hypothetical protein